MYSSSHQQPHFSAMCPHHQGGGRRGEDKIEPGQLFMLWGKERGENNGPEAAQSTTESQPHGVRSRGQGQPPPPKVSKTAVDVGRHRPPVAIPPWIPTSTFWMESILSSLWLSHRLVLFLPFQCLVLCPVLEPTNNGLEPGFTPLAFKANGAETLSKGLLATSSPIHMMTGIEHCRGLRNANRAMPLETHLTLLILPMESWRMELLFSPTPLFYF